MVVNTFPNQRGHGQGAGLAPRSTASLESRGAQLLAGGFHHARADPIPLLPILDVIGDRSSRLQISESECPTLPAPPPTLVTLIVTVAARFRVRPH